MLDREVPPWIRITVGVDRGDGEETQVIPPEDFETYQWGWMPSDERPPDWPTT